MAAVACACVYLKNGFPNFCTTIQAANVLRHINTLNHVRQQSNTAKTGVWSRLKSLVKSFLNGSKLLIRDVKQMGALKRRSKYLLPITVEKMKDLHMKKLSSSLTREEFLFVIKINKDLRKVLAPLILFWVPFLGYIAPLVAFMFPQHLLSSHFLTESQQKDVYKKQLVARTAAKEEMIRLFAQEQKLKELSASFEPNKFPSFSSTLLSRSHKVILCEMWGLTTWLPVLMPERKLRREMLVYATADVLMKLENSESVILQDDPLEKECMIRCLLPPQSVQDQVEYLEKWFQVSPDVIVKDGDPFVLALFPIWVDWLKKREDVQL